MTDSVALLEIQRARKALECYCAARNPALKKAGIVLRCIQLKEDLVLTESLRAEGVADSSSDRPLVRLRYEHKRWLLHWYTSNNRWAPYPHLPKAGSVQRIIDELEQAPLHVCWG